MTAEADGVSITTVFRARSNDPAISPETRERVPAVVGA
jgi:DNA-binding LacI/PurR family transcriptional regulator